MVAASGVIGNERLRRAKISLLAGNTRILRVLSHLWVLEKAERHSVEQGNPDR
jgi:hypothetical protein